jgi:UDP-2,3-diacylglucosamine pyrophosphatase LpxH
MLVIISDLHLNDGTTGPAIDSGAFQVFTDRLRDLAFRASWRADGRYRPIDRIDLLLLGDVLDLIHSTRWLRTPARPWDDASSPEVAATVSDIIGDILERNAGSLASLRALAGDGAVRVPPATESGRPARGVEDQPVPAHIYYLVGNYDWFLHLRGGSYDSLRRAVARQLGLANPPKTPFPHDPVECDVVLEAMRRHRLFARHGDMYDPIHFDGDRDASSLGDAIVIELATRFAAGVEEELGDDLPAGLAWGLKEIDHIRPLLLIPAWMEGLLERACPSAAIRRHVKGTWDRLAAEFLELDAVRRRDAWRPSDLVDGLAQALKFNRRPPIGWVRRITAWLQSVRGAEADSYYPHALVEADFRNRRARHIVYGHTHVAESVPLEASYADGFVLHQMYFNAGAWRRVYRPTKWAPGGHEFIPAENMTYLTFFLADERGGRSFETWTGALGTSAVERSRHRLDCGQMDQAAAQHASKPAVRVGPPHFRGAATEASAESARRR